MLTHNNRCTNIPTSISICNRLKKWDYKLCTVHRVILFSCSFLCKCVTKLWFNHQVMPVFLLSDWLICYWLYSIFRLGKKKSAVLNFWRLRTVEIQIIKFLLFQLLRISGIPEDLNKMHYVASWIYIIGLLDVSFYKSAYVENFW